MKLSFFKKIAIGLVAVSLVASSLVLATGVAAANPSSLTLQSQSVNNGATFSVTVTASTASGVPVAGGQAYITYNANALTYNPASPLKNTYNQNTPYFGSGEFDATAQASISNGVGTIILTSTNGGAPNPSVSGTGVWATLNFTAQSAANNSIQTIGFVTANSYLANSNPAAVPTDLNVGTITVGTPTFPQLDVTSSTVTPVSGNPLQFNINCVVRNTGSAATTGSVPCTYSINGQTPVSFTVTTSPIAASGSANITEGPITMASPTSVAGNTDSVQIATTYSGTQISTANNTTTLSYTLTPSLVVTSIATNPTSSSGTPSTSTTYQIVYTITNQGAGYAAASNTTITINGINSTAACPALIPGANTGSITTGTITATPMDTDQVTPANGTGTTINYYYAPAGTLTGNNNVTGSITSQFSFTGPSAVNSWTYSGNTGSPSAAFFPGKVNTNAVAESMAVTSSGSWSVTVSSDQPASGKMTEWNGSIYASPITGGNAVSLGQPLGISSGQGNCYDANHNLYTAATLSSAVNTPTLAIGNVTGLSGQSQYTWTIPLAYSQSVSYSDPSLSSGYIYHLTLTYTCSSTNY